VLQRQANLEIAWSLNSTLQLKKLLRLRFACASLLRSPSCSPKRHNNV
jgi:hypothetical protein